MASLGNHGGARNTAGAHGAEAETARAWDSLGQAASCVREARTGPGCPASPRRLSGKRTDRFRIPCTRLSVSVKGVPFQHELGRTPRILVSCPAPCNDRPMAPDRPARVLPIFTLLVIAAVSSCGAEDAPAPSSTGITKTPSATPATRPASSTPTATLTATHAPTTAAPKPKPKPKPTDPAAACASRKGNPGEIYVWNSYGSDQPPDAMRLGAGYVWNFGDRTCITSTQFALTTNPGLPGFCTKVAKVSANPGYRVDDVPAPRLKHIIGQSGDC